MGNDEQNLFVLLKPVLIFLFVVAVFVGIVSLVLNSLNSFTTNFPTTDGTKPLWPVKDQRIDYTTYSPTIRFPDGASPGEFGYGGAPAGIYSGWVKPSYPPSAIIINPDYTEHMVQRFEPQFSKSKVETGNLF